jgi:hypothetical protein
MERDYTEIHDELSSVYLFHSRGPDESDPSKWTDAGIYAV